MKSRRKTTSKQELIYNYILRNNDRPPETKVVLKHFLLSSSSQITANQLFMQISGDAILLVINLLLVPLICHDLLKMAVNTRHRKSQRPPPPIRQ